MEWLIQILNSVQYGLLLFLVASGLTLIFGIMGVINLAHGSFYMIGAYLAFTLAEKTGSLWTALPLGWTASAVDGQRRASIRNRQIASVKSFKSD